MSILYETGARIGEVGGLLIKNITDDQFSYILHMDGKTGKRSVRIIVSQKYLVDWLNDHPFRDNPNSPLWLNQYNNPVEYNTLRKLILRAMKRAKIKKRVYPHLFRHSRATHLLNSKELTEGQVKVLMGWEKDSDMLSVYSHLTTKDANDALLQMHGITQKPKEKVKAKKCYVCGILNPGKSKFCFKCGRALNVKTIVELSESRFEDDEKLLHLVLSKITPQMRDEIKQGLLKTSK